MSKEVEAYELRVAFSGPATTLAKGVCLNREILEFCFIMRNSCRGANSETVCLSNAAIEIKPGKPGSWGCRDFLIWK